MPAVRILPLMILIPISEYLGMMIGLMIPGLVKAMWLPFSLARVKPSASNIFTCVFQSVGVIRGIQRLKIDRDIDHICRCRLFRLGLMMKRVESTLPQHLLKGAHFKAGLDEELDGFDEIGAGMILVVALRVNIEDGTRCNKQRSVLFDLNGEAELNI